jgi:hypothetical protein
MALSFKVRLDKIVAYQSEAQQAGSWLAFLASMPSASSHQKALTPKL